MNTHDNTAVAGAAARLLSAAPDRTIFDSTLDRLLGLCRALDMNEESRSIVDLYRRMAAGWGDRPLSAGPLWRSHVGDDDTPVEFSVAFAANPELRIMVEPLAAKPSLWANWAASLALLESLAVDFDVDLTRLRQVQDLFYPSCGDATFALWVAAVFPKRRSPAFKLYLNPDARGRIDAAANVEAALRRLGLGGAWRAIARTLARRGPELDELKYVSLDLCTSKAARVKVYARHRNATVADLESAAAGCPSYRRGEVTAFMSAMGIVEGETLSGRAPFTCYAFVQGHGDQPASVTTHFPINGYASDDRDAALRIRRAFEACRLPAGPYARALSALGNRPLAAGVGMQSYASFRRDPDSCRLTVYFPLELYAPGRIAPPQASEPPRSPDELSARLIALEAIRHPFFTRLGQASGARRTEEDLAANLNLAMLGYFSRLASIAARADTPAVRLALSELMCTEVRRAERRRQQPDGREGVPCGPRATERGAVPCLEPGKQLEARMADAIEAADVYEAVGALASIESFFNQATALLGVRATSSNARRPSVDADSPGPASAALAHDLVRAVSPSRLDGVWRGMTTMRRAIWQFWDDLYFIGEDSITASPGYTSRHGSALNDGPRQESL